MEHICYYHPLDSNDMTKLKKLAIDFKSKLGHLLKSKSFQNQIKTMRDKYNIPLNGIKHFKVTDVLSDEQQRQCIEQYNNRMSICHNDNELKSFNINVKSKKKEFDNDLKKILRENELPVRFVNVLRSYIFYDQERFFYDSMGDHFSKSLVHIFKDGEDHRIFIEVFADTKKSHILKAWDQININELIKEYKLPGKHLFRATNYYETKRHMNGEEVTDEDGFEIRDYTQKNIMKHRYLKNNK